MSAAYQRYKSHAHRIMLNVTLDTNGCWNWRGALSTGGYGMACIGLGGAGRKRTALVHRLSYETFVGPIPEGLQIDHLCRNRRCCNPAHLEAVTAAVNTHRSPFTAAALNAAKTHCPRGHAYDELNTRRDRDGSRSCRACSRERGAA